ncbi:hypothetical protein ACT91Q_05010 [Brevibacillus thermoruber]|uniref:hypothetical protein n=1 Tax=Brevibacillus thermoruber TaxID=33942 RepID=UPI004041F407
MSCCSTFGRRITILTVDPGCAGQTFIPEKRKNIRHVKRLRPPCCMGAPASLG